MVKTWKASKLARDTHFLERVEVGIGENMGSKQGHSLPREGQRLGLVRTWKASKLARDTHFLERAEVGIGENMESKQTSKGHLLPREGRGWDW